MGLIDILFRRHLKADDSFGKIALKRGYVTDVELSEALAQQEEQAPLGQILVDMEIITMDERDDILLEIQSRKATKTQRASLALARQRKVISRLRVKSDQLADTSRTVNAAFEQSG